MNGLAPRNAEVVTLGCRLNAAESERIAAILGEGCETVVVNSCAVTQEAVRQTRRAIRRLRRKAPDARVVVTGCAADIEASALAAMPEVDALVPNEAKLDRSAWIDVGAIAADKTAPEIAPADSRARTRAFVPVQTGCDHSCTFCVIPQGRGPSRSLPVAQVLNEIAQHLEAGAPEIVLTGVDVTSWGHDLDGEQQLGVLAKAILDEFPTLARLRLSSVDGAEIDPLLEELLAHESRMMPHLHLSLQSGDDMILKRMKRRHDRAGAIALVERLKARRPQIAIGADLIAGFPTEDDRMHANNVSIVEACQVVHGHVFPFSPRPGTPAARMPQIDPAMVRQRAADVRAAVACQRDQWLSSLIGSTARVLVENDGTGHGEDFAPTRMPGGERGTIVEARLTGLHDGILTGEPT